ncbi:hypothetical protein [Staphylococcus epidermidis]|uniref:hypothetical protein n=1 Tax=Staphylococcus epidermidis TaxID=1282 RepID=UPI0012B1D39B|nr:hypothetical protein [Staphylococcus epidermidis]QGM88220.1 hypothetical protein GFV05_06290 [Staphylococcus epidermidis]
MYSRLKLKDATRSMISNNDKVLMTLEDENINILHIETDINTADTLIQHFSNQQSSPDSCVKCYTMFLPFLLIKIDVFS